MDEQLKATNPQLWAVKHMLRNVYVPAFLNKLAQYGISPRDKEDLTNLVKMAAMLSQVEQKAVAQGAHKDETSSFIKQSADELSSQVCGVSVTEQQNEQVKLASAMQRVTTDPETLQAALWYAVAANQQ